MSRIARVVVPGIPHHITQRGVRSMRIFFSHQDRYEYLELLHEQGTNNGLHFASYVLMDNHVHLVAVPEKEDSLRKAVGEAHRRYTLGINRRFEKKRYLFQGRINKEEWKNFLQTDSPGMKSLRKKTKTGRPCGSKNFVDQLEEITGRVLHPRRLGKKGRKTGT